MLNEKDYCDYDTCVALKELGYPTKMTFIGEQATIEISINSGLIQLYEAQKWLREEKNIIVEVFVDDDSDTPITYNIYKDSECIVHHHGNYYSVKDWNIALLEGIKGAIRILKEKENGN